MRTFRELKVWQKAHQLALAVYRATRSFPREETYGLTSQIRRAAISTAANIVEGNERRSEKDFAHFLNMAQGSNEELKYLTQVAAELGYMPQKSQAELESLSHEVGAMLHGLTIRLRA
jgi:four helix bundle protein